MNDVEAVKNLVLKYPKLHTHIESWLNEDLEAIDIFLKLDDMFAPRESCSFKIDNFEKIQKLDKNDTERFLNMFIIENEFSRRNANRPMNTLVPVGSTTRRNIDIFENLNPDLNKFELFFKDIYPYMPGYTPSPKDKEDFINYLRRNENLKEEYPNLRVVQYLFDDEIDIDSEIFTNIKNDVVLNNIHVVDHLMFTKKTFDKIKATPSLLDVLRYNISNNFIIALKELYKKGEIDDEYVMDFITPLSNIAVPTKHYTRIESIFNKVPYDMTHDLFYALVELIDDCRILLDNKALVDIMCDQQIKHSKRFSPINLLSHKMEFVFNIPNHKLSRHISEMFTTKTVYQLRFDGVDIDMVLNNLRRFSSTITVDFVYLDSDGAFEMIKKLNEFGLRISKISNAYFNKEFMEKIIAKFENEGTYGVNSRFFVNYTSDNFIDLDVEKIDNDLDMTKYKTNLLTVLT